MLLAEHDVDPAVTPAQAYAEVTRQYARQMRAYARSIRAYNESVRLRTVRLARRTGQLWTPDRAPGPVGEPRRPNPVDTLVAMRSLPPSAPAPASTAPLTRRQFEVARLIARGLSNEQIAQELVLTPGTVGNHVGHILRRLGARNRAQVASWVTQVTARGGGDDSLAS
jgi:DNA-binding NarL/FixJ family response regulator